MQKGVTLHAHKIITNYLTISITVILVQPFVNSIETEYTFKQFSQTSDMLTIIN